ncbi:unnamed protein product, partial [marine sediment metagenome]
ARTNDNLPFFTWENLSAENILKYRLVIDNDVNFADGDNSYDNQILTDNWDNFKTHIENALPEGTWYWKVQAENADNWGPFSETRTLTVDTTPPQVVSLSLSHYVINSDNAGQRFLITVEFNEPMDNSVNPIISLIPNIGGVDIVRAGGDTSDYWASDNIFIENSYIAYPDADHENYDVDVSVASAKDLAGNYNTSA